ncbi:RHS repeat-associated core domain-containing protein [Pseudomonas sp. H3(2019)]|uniref:RHS repeat-associated core domain-containing protein n=1 Tax=Pseudomonas sp. H3(2019) TaxID=2598724 RepID=UPI001191199E|nr:RHS repeat-associated core domain-containing protein [Pseudomonas sp. H3(2019)]TVT85532.1 RHS repeat protein [Pseudomonas sp. H3(2019)]
MTHANTPTLAVIDPRGLAVRAVAYHRRKAGETAESHITQQVYDTAGRAVHSRDPRLFQLLEGGSGEAVNQSTVFSLSGAALLSDNSDAGWRLGLLGAAGQRLQGWDQKRNHSRAIHDDLLRPSAVFEQALGEPERCTGRFSYADATEEAAVHNRCGRLIRHDDTTGTQHFTEFSLAGAPLEQSRQFIADPQWSVNWPELETERDALLELEPATTRLRYNAIGEPCEQTDAEGNRQTFSQTRAGELREVRLKLGNAAEEKTLVSAIHYNAFGQIEQQRAGNGVVSCATYSAEDGRLLQLKAQAQGKAARQDLTYDYDPAGNIRSISDASQSIRYFRNQRVAAINTYEYDSLYRLIFACGRQIRNVSSGPHLPAFQSPADPGQLENFQQTYHYDPAGNLELLQHTADSGSRTEHTAVAALNNRSLPYSADGKRPGEDDIRAAYDRNGNLNTLQPGQPLLWDPRNQLRQVDQVVRDDEPNDAEYYLYDDSGQRQRKIRTAYTGKLTRTHETRYLPGLEIRTTPEETLHVITVQAGRCSVQVLHWKNGQRADIPENQHRYTFSDHLGSSTLELDEQAELISQECYYPYGATCWWAGRDKVEASYKTLRYSGKERDATGLYYYGHRYYLAWRQRWLSADPAGPTDGLNLYAMVHGNPVGHVDIAGLADDHAQAVRTGQLRDASSSAFVRDFISRGMGGLAQMSTVAALNTLRPSHASNTALEITAGALEGIAVGIVGGGLAARLHRHAVAVGAVAGLLIGVSPAAWSHDGGSTDESEIELNQVAINRIGAAVGAITREISQQILRGHGANFPWGSVSLRQRLPTFHRTAAAYAITNVLNGAFGRLVPESIRSWISPLMEGTDGFVGTWLRGRHPETTYAAGTTALQTPPFVDTAFGAAGRITSSQFAFGVITAVEAVTAHITGLPVSERGESVNMISGAISGGFLSLTDYRAGVMQVAQDGYRGFRPQVVDSMNSDVQTTTARFPGRQIQRRHSYTNA